jgi:hypothetical protein
MENDKQTEEKHPERSPKSRRDYALPADNILDDKYSNKLVDPMNEESMQYLTDDFFMYQFKSHWCPITVQHNWQSCLYAHNYQDARRSPSMGYGPQPCPHWDKKERAPLYGQRCPNGVLCPHSHGAKEQLYHPLYFKTVVCWDYTHVRDGCPRGKLCAFFHRRKDQRRVNEQLLPDYNHLLPQEALMCLQPDFGFPPFTSGDKEGLGVGQSAHPPIQDSTMHNSAGNEGMGYSEYWYDEGNGRQDMVPRGGKAGKGGPMPPSPMSGSPMPGSPMSGGPMSGRPMPGSPMAGNIGPVSHMSPPMSPMHAPPMPMRAPPGGLDGTPVSSPTNRGGETPMQPMMYMDPNPEDCNGSPQTVHHGEMGQSFMMPMMAPSNQQVPMSPQGYPMMQGNMGNMMLVPTPFPNQFHQNVPNLIPPASAPPMPNSAKDDDLFDVRSADSMEMMYDRQMPFMPPMGLQMQNGVLQQVGCQRQSIETLTTSAGEGTTSESVSQSD